GTPAAARRSRRWTCGRCCHASRPARWWCPGSPTRPPRPRSARRSRRPSPAPGSRSSRARHTSRPWSAPERSAGCWPNTWRDDVSPSDRYEAGMTVRREVLGDAHVDRAVARTDEFTADFQDLITRYAWGEIWTRDGLDRRTRSCVTLALLAALRCE